MREWKNGREKKSVKKNVLVSRLLKGTTRVQSCLDTF